MKSNLGQVRHDWTTEEIRHLMDQPFNDLIFQAQTVHRRHFDPNEIQTSTLVNIKSGGCAEDCAYCSQSARNKTQIEKESMMDVQEVLEKALMPKKKGQLVSAWEQLGAIPPPKTSQKYLKWSR